LENAEQRKPKECVIVEICFFSLVSIIWVLLRLSIRILLVTFSIVIVSLIQPALAETGCKKMVANGAGFWHPFSYRTADGELTGIAVDMAKEAAKRIGISLEIYPDMPWKRILMNLQLGKIDLVLSAYWNEERAEKYLYSVPVVEEEIGVFVRAGSSFPFSSFHDLKGKLGLRVFAGSLGQEFDTYARENLEFQTVLESGPMLKMLVLGRADYGIQGALEGEFYIEKLGLGTQVQRLPKPLVINDVHFLMNRATKCGSKIDSLNAAIIELQNSGYLSSLVAKHIK